MFAVSELSIVMKKMNSRKLILMDFYVYPLCCNDVKWVMQYDGLSQYIFYAISQQILQLTYHRTEHTYLPLSRKYLNNNTSTSTWKQDTSTTWVVRGVKGYNLEELIDISAISSKTMFVVCVNFFSIVVCRFVTREQLHPRPRHNHFHFLLMLARMKFATGYSLAFMKWGRELMG